MHHTWGNQVEVHASSSHQIELKRVGLLGDNLMAASSGAPATSESRRVTEAAAVTEVHEAGSADTPGARRVEHDSPTATGAPVPAVSRPGILAAWGAEVSGITPGAQRVEPDSPSATGAPVPAASITEPAAQGAEVSSEVGVPGPQQLEPDSLPAASAPAPAALAPPEPAAQVAAANSSDDEDWNDAWTVVEDAGTYAAPEYHDASTTSTQHAFEWAANEWQDDPMR